MSVKTMTSREFGARAGPQPVKGEKERNLEVMMRRLKKRQEADDSDMILPPCFSSKNYPRPGKDGTQLRGR